jgi:uncharacterized protein (TIGR02452 family)
MESGTIKPQPTDEELKEIARQKRKKYLAEVFKSTKAYCKEKHLTKVKTFKVSGRVDELYAEHQPEIKVMDWDCVNVADMLALEGKTCMINMANAIHRGGGVERGAMAQEEELCRRSNLWYGLKKSYYPMGDLEFTYQKNVKFFKDKDYDLSAPFKCDIITIAAPCLIGYKPNKFPPHYSFIFEEKIKQALWFPAQMGVNNLVMSALGCGAFKNNPIFVSRLFKKYLKNLPYNKVYFAILDDSNSKANGISNFLTFKNMLT